MFCGKCGNQVLDGEEFCGKCGSKVEHDTLENTNPEHIEISGPIIDIQNHDSKNLDEPPKKGIKYAIVILIVVLVLVLGGVYIAINSTIFNKDTKTTETTASETQTEYTTEQPTEIETTETETTTTTNANNYVVNTGIDNLNLNMRSGPGVDYKDMGNIPDGTKLYVSEITDGWGHTEYKGKDCWVSMDYLEAI